MRFKPLIIFRLLERIKIETNSRLVGSNLVKLHKVRSFYDTKSHPIQLLSTYNVLVFFLFVFVHFQKGTKREK